MRLRQIIGALLSTSVLTTTVVMPQTTVYAASTFASATEFLEDVIDVALTEIDSPSKDTAVTTTMIKFSVAGDEVSFNGNVVGYWDSSTSNTLYADAGKTTEIIEETANGYEVSPTLLHTILNDVNSNIVENYVPATSDWSKIIGKYDVTLGDITIPASQWVDLPLGGNLSRNYLNLSELTGIRGPDLIDNNDNMIYIQAWMIDSNGDLYLQNGVQAVYEGSNSYDGYYVTYPDWLQSTAPPSLSMWPYTGGNSSLSISVRTTNLLKASIRAQTINSENIGIYATYYMTDTTNSSSWYTGFSSDRRAALEQFSRLYKIDEPSKQNTSDVTTAKRTGVMFFIRSQVDTSSVSLHNQRLKMFESQSCSKRVHGNTLLTRRLNTLSSLLATDTVTVKSTGWTVNGQDNIDIYIADQSLNNAGDTADISAIADIEALKFHVIVPTTLPIYVDDANVTYVADNADITNKSGAAVKLTAVDIVPVADSGWTMVDATPSSEIGAKEFTFSTTIEKDKVLATSEVYPFEYSAKLSPTTEACMNLELATVLVTVDWAE